MRTAILAGIAATLTAAACAAGGTTHTPGIDLALTGVEPLGGGFHYEGWLVVDGEPVSTGRFNVDDDGILVDLEGEAVLDVFDAGVDLSRAAGFRITIEPPEDGDAAPSQVTLLAGGFEAGVAELSVRAPEAFGTDFSGSTAVFILATPSDGEATQERSGIWFVHPDGRPGLDLPELPEGWAYEGWAFIDNVPVTTGSFTDPAGPDSFDRYSQDGPVPPLPGEDFLIDAPEGVTFPPELRGQRVVVSIEPVPDTGSGPFYLRPLGFDLPADATDHVAYEMHYDAAGFPTGVATIVGQP